MLQVDFNQKFRQPERLLPFQSGSAGVVASKNSMRKAETPRFQGAFSGLGNRALNQATNGLLPIFQKITEVFLVAFLAQDVVAMWLPRVGTSLKVGRIPYDPQQDPAARNLPFAEQVKKWIVGNTRGLNWVNFNEESKREFATGPGVLMIPAVVFAAARRLFGKSAVEMSYGSLRGMSMGFQDHLAQSGLKDATGTISQEAYRKELAQYLTSLFDDAELRTTRLTRQKTYGQYLEDWSRRWADGVFGVYDQTKAKNQKEALHQLADEFKTTLTGFNRKHRLLPYTVNGKQVSENLLHRSDHAWVRFQKSAELSQKPINSLLHHIERWSDFAKAVWERKSSRGVGSVAETLPKLVESTFHKLAAKKLAVALGTIVLSGFYLVKLAFWAQNHDSYGATRLLQHDAGGAQSGASPSGAAAHKTTQAALQPSFPSQPYVPVAIRFQAQVEGGRAE